MRRRPNFFVVGAPKCGTTAIYEYLKPHPDIFMPVRKELNYFTQDLQHTEFSTVVSDLSTYLKYYDDAQDEKILGDTSSAHLFSKGAAQAIYELSPKAKIIIMLRNPVDVMYSLYYQMIFNGNEDIENFAAALEAEATRKQGQNLPKNVRIIDHLFYRERVHFVPQVKRYFDTFGREQILILLQEDLLHNPQHYVAQILEFLGVDNTYEPDYRLVNTNKVIRSTWLRHFYTLPILIRLSDRFPKFSQSVYDVLRQFNTVYAKREAMPSDLRLALLKEYQPAIQELAQLIERDLDHWTNELNDHA